jgi:hypothetical protein
MSLENLSMQNASEAVLFNPASMPVQRWKLQLWRGCNHITEMRQEHGLLRSAAVFLTSSRKERALKYVTPTSIWELLFEWQQVGHGKFKQALPRHLFMNPVVIQKPKKDEVTVFPSPIIVLPLLHTTLPQPPSLQRPWVNRKLSYPGPVNWRMGFVSDSAHD